MTEILRQAYAIAAEHQAAHCSALEAECRLLDLGFHSIRFDAQGVSAASYLGVKYDLTKVACLAAKYEGISIDV